MIAFADIYSFKFSTFTPEPTSTGMPTVSWTSVMHEEIYHPLIDVHLYKFLDL